jgi:hypothetical protein
MASDITNIVLLQHIQAMKSGLESQMEALKNSLESKIVSLDTRVDTLTTEMQRGFEEARQHRQALQEDLEATMLMLSKHEAKLARL